MSPSAAKMHQGQRPRMAQDFSHSIYRHSKTSRQRTNFVYAYNEFLIAPTLTVKKCTLSLEGNASKEALRCFLITDFINNCGMYQVNKILVISLKLMLSILTILA